MATTHTPLDGINKSLVIHNTKLDEAITLLDNYHPLALTSIKDLADRFSELYSQLFSETEKLIDTVASETDNMSIAVMAKDTASTAKKASLIKKYTPYVIAAGKLVGLIGKIVAKYIIIIIMLGERIIEMAVAGVALGLNAAMDFMASLITSLAEILIVLKTKAINAGKKAAKDYMVKKYNAEIKTLEANKLKPETTPEQKKNIDKQISILKIKIVSVSNFLATPQ